MDIIVINRHNHQASCSFPDIDSMGYFIYRLHDGMIITICLVLPFQIIFSLKAIYFP